MQRSTFYNQKEWYFGERQIHRLFQFMLTKDPPPPLYELIFYNNVFMMHEAYNVGSKCYGSFQTLFLFYLNQQQKKKNTHTVLEQYNARTLILIIFQNHICYFVEHFTAFIITITIIIG